jgi:tRNA pseudouridine55 synthase
VEKLDRNFRGILNTYKPVGPSSFAMIKKLRNVLTEKKIGHAGTLDPLASGVLVVAVGREFTKKIEKIQKLKKAYVASLRLGEFSTTDDGEGDKERVIFKKESSIKEVERCLQANTGRRMQTPPKYSAKKIAGQRAYKLARAGRDFTLEPKEITIYEINTIEYKFPNLKVEVICSSGTYIRSLAREIGSCLKTGAYLKSLERTAVGNYKMEDAIKLK